MKTTKQENRKLKIASASVWDHANSSPETNSKELKICCGLLKLLKIGNDSIFNSTIQSLFHIPILTDCFGKTSTEKCECVICIVQSLYQTTKQSQLPCDPTNVYKMLQKNNRFSMILNGTPQDARDFLKHLIQEMAHPSHPYINFANMFSFQTNIDIKCLKCKIGYKNINNVRDFVVDMRGQTSVKQAFEMFFEVEIVEKYNCIACMESVLASKKWKLLNTPECLCLILSETNSDIKIDRNLNFKCYIEGRVSYWKYEVASVINHFGSSYNKGPYITTVYNDNTIYTLDDSKVQEDSEYLGCFPYILFYERIEEIHIEELKEWTPTVIIEETDSDDEFQMTSIIETESHNIETEVITANSNKHHREGKTISTKEKNTEPVQPSERPKRVTRRNRQFLDSSVWDNNSSSSSLSLGSRKRQASIPSKPHNLSAETKHPNNQPKNATPHNVASILKIPGKPDRTGTKPKNFVRFRFQIDCSAANEVNVDELINFFKENMKVDGKKKNLIGRVTIDRRKSNINFMSKVILKKKYLKHLAKQHLKKNKQFKYHVISKNNRAYKILLK